MGCKEWCWVQDSLLWRAPLVEEFSQIVDGLQLGITSLGRCLFDLTGEDVEGMKKSILRREGWLWKLGVHESYRVG